MQVIGIDDNYYTLTSISILQKIPNKFTTKYGGGLPNPLFMKLPDGSEWEVNRAKDNGEIWLEKGWKEFAEHFSLDQGCFVCFRYDGTSKVHVRIMDQSGVEIEYPCVTGHENDNHVQTKEQHNLTLDEGPHQKAEQIWGKDSLFV